MERDAGVLRWLSLARLGGGRIARSGLPGARAGAHSERSVDAPAAAWAAEDGAERRAQRRPTTAEQLLTPQHFQLNTRGICACLSPDIALGTRATRCMLTVARQRAWPKSEMCHV